MQYFKIAQEGAKIYQLGYLLLNLPIVQKPSLAPLVPGAYLFVTMRGAGGGGAITFLANTIQSFNAFCKLCFCIGLDMYING